MGTLQAAIYARVSSERQAETQTVASQVAALCERVAADGLALPEAMQFIDEGYSGAVLVRPALERLRDCIAAGAVDRLYVHSPDRLARKYAYQVFLVDEFQRAGVEVLFLSRALGRNPEDDLLLQVQGMMAEYERAKSIERHRRGKLHAARRGAVNVLGGAPWGVATFGSSRLLLHRLEHRHGQGGKPGRHDRHGRQQHRPLRSQPRTPVIARVIKQTLPTPEPTHPVGHGPLRPPPLTDWIHAHPLAQLHLYRIREADDSNQPRHHRLGGQGDYGSPDRPMMMPLPVRLLNRHPPGILRPRLRDRRRGGE
jgi:predicted site-specific integrase-resolvase